LRRRAEGGAQRHVNEVPHPDTADSAPSQSASH
jgi:hypothetical protein